MKRSFALPKEKKNHKNFLRSRRSSYQKEQAGSGECKKGRKKELRGEEGTRGLKGREEEENSIFIREFTMSSTRGLCNFCMSLIHCNWMMMMPQKVAE